MMQCTPSLGIACAISATVLHARRSARSTRQRLTWKSEFRTSAQAHKIRRYGKYQWDLPGSMSAIAFHEKAGRSQVRFALLLLYFFFFFPAVFGQSGPEQSRARSARRSEPLTARTALPAWRREEKGAPDLFRAEKSTPQLRCALRHCRHPSIRTLSGRLSPGASWVFSFQPVLPPVRRPLSWLQLRSWARP